MEKAKPREESIELCDACAQPAPAECPIFYECPECGLHVCTRCCGGVGTICFDCENAEIDEKAP